MRSLAASPARSSHPRFRYAIVVSAIVLIFYIVICGIGCAIPSRLARWHDPADTLIYHPWVLTGAGTYMPAYYSDENGHWLCNARNRKPIELCNRSGRDFGEAVNL